ncbi:MAG: LacI family transcriptional regulator [Intrasporangium sp.]|uniref:LacI family DNA-binding transcriptional regulator n=1 Tax=Intrasporangium sp. TaxID=1925024 RepID=UPI0026496A8A|nr:LacI family DNA-binding transcriptional regulator [Intrasporangium sp.]MDN5797123.1 LacI family transcriptional regulator [Intrasporangium sp.]
MTRLSTRATAPRPTMADVAAEANVSVKTVSRVVNREPGVRPETAARVIAVVERVGFRRADTSRPLRAGRTNTIGLVVEDLANPFYSQVGAAVEREARIRRHQLITASAEGSPSRERAVLAELIARRVDGLVVVPAGATPSLDPEVAESGTPIVYLDRPVRGAADMILSDNHGGIRSAMEHLVAHGHRRVGFLGDDGQFWTARQRREAFATVHDDLHLPGAPRICMGPHSATSVGEILEAWSTGKEPVTALITGNNRVTVHTLRAMRRLDLPLAIVGYDDFELADLIDPPVTVIHQDPAAMGQKAAQQLFVRLLGDESAPTTVVMPTRLIVRGSGRPHQVHATVSPIRPEPGGHRV